MNSKLQQFVRHFFETRGLTPDEGQAEQLQGDGSKRLFWRIPCVESGERFIVLSNFPGDACSRRENFASVRIGLHLKSKGAPVPEIYASDLDNGWIIMEDLGRLRLQDVLAAGEDPMPLYREIITLLFHLQLKGAEGFDTAWCCQTPYYDHTVMQTYESTYFVEAFLGVYLGLKKDWVELREPFAYVADRLSQSRNFFFLYPRFPVSKHTGRTWSNRFCRLAGGASWAPGLRPGFAPHRSLCRSFPGNPGSHFSRI